jgi:hypothetical protein
MSKMSVARSLAKSPEWHCTAFVVPPTIASHVGGTYLISLRKKLQPGDAQWAAKKEILDFLVDGEAKTVQIFDARTMDIIKESHKILKK